MIVIKRDGSKQLFDKQRIITAITLALVDAGLNDPTFASTVGSQIENQLHATEVQIEDIQSLVESKLMGSKYKDVARSFIEYRTTRDIARESSSALNKEIQGLVKQTNTLLMNENANKDAKRIPTQRDLLAGIVSKHYALKHILPKDIAKAHEKGEIHYHDLDYAPFFPMVNCCLIDLGNMLKSGFKLGNAEIDTPKSITTACTIMTQVIAQVASHIYGGNTINNIDIILEPYVEATYQKHLEIASDWLPAGCVHEEYALARTKKDTYDAFQCAEYQINTLHTANGQTPFCTFGFGLGTSEWSRLIQTSILEVRMKGLGKQGHTAVFPKLIFAIKDGLNHKVGDPNYDIKQLALECSTNRMYPDILNYDQLVNRTGSFKFPMGCRSFLNAWENEQGEQVHDGRNNLGVVTLNLPRLALQSKDTADFFKRLHKRLILCKSALMTRVQRLEHVQAKVAPILYCEGAFGVRLQPDDYIIDIFKNGRASISLGYIGLHETIIALRGNDTELLNDTESKQLSYDILTTMKIACDEWKAETGYAFSLYGTPSENLCDRFCRLDTAEFGIVDGVTSKGFYTNSFHLSVEKDTDPFSKIDFESPYIDTTMGGFISYAEFPNMRNNVKGLEAVWDYTYNKLPYFGTNTPIDVCHSCDYKGEFLATSKGFECPQCGNTDSQKMNVIRRVCGYLGESNNRPFNQGKQTEVQLRCKHIK